MEIRARDGGCDLCSLYVPTGQPPTHRPADGGWLLESPLHELTGINLAVDCMAPGCRRDRTYASVTSRGPSARTAPWAIAAPDALSADGCGGRVATAWLETGADLNERIRLRRVALRGPEARE
jgi:hypothetical protein